MVGGIRVVVGREGRRPSAEVQRAGELSEQPLPPPRRDGGGGRHASQPAEGRGARATGAAGVEAQALRPRSPLAPSEFSLVVSSLRLRQLALGPSLASSSELG